MPHHNALLLFESTSTTAVMKDHENREWVGLLRSISGRSYELLERRYYLALGHFRSRRKRPRLPGQLEVTAPSKEAGFQLVLRALDQRKSSRKAAIARDEPAIFVEAQPDRGDAGLPGALRDSSIEPPTLRDLLDGPGRPPCDALCLIRAFLAAPLLGIDDSPAAIHILLRSNPTFAHACGFLGRDVSKLPGEWTSRQLPSLSKLEEFKEVMIRYGLWQAARIVEVRSNLADGVVETEDTLAFDTTHIEANSHCGNVMPAGAGEKLGKKTKHRKVPRTRKTCSCGKSQWDRCEHSWVSTDPGAAVVVKGRTRIYWAHKSSVVAFGDSEIPIDVRVLQYAAEHDGKTLIPHMEVLQRDLPEVVSGLRHVLADDAYKANQDAVAEFRDGIRLTVPIHPNTRSKATIAANHAGIDRFTPIGVPVCQGGHRFEMMGRDLSRERFIWVAPDDPRGQSVCSYCTVESACRSRGKRRTIRVDRDDFPQIDWNHPQHLRRNRTRYHARTGVERAIKRLKVDLKGETLTYRNSLRVQAHLDRKLLTLHLLLRIAATE